MFMMSFRLRRTGIVAGGLALALVLGLGIASIGNLWGSRAVSGGSVAAEQVKETKPSVKMKKAPGKTEEERLAFIQSFGWEVEVEAVEIMEVIIPKEFDEVYEQYNTIQKKQGGDLTEFAGKRCKRYSYNITNYPGTDQPVRINLLIYKNKIVGGDVSSLDVDGFIHGFELPQGLSENS